MNYERYRKQRLITFQSTWIVSPAYHLEFEHYYKCGYKFNTRAMRPPPPTTFTKKNMTITTVIPSGGVIAYKTNVFSQE